MPKRTLPAQSQLRPSASGSKHHQYPALHVGTPPAALTDAAAQRRAGQGAAAPGVLMGSDCGSSQEAVGRRRTARGERDAGARVPSKLERPSGLVGLKKQRESILIPPEESSRRRLLKMRRIILGSAKGIESALQSDGFRYRVGFVTLTYARDGDWHYAN